VEVMKDPVEEDDLEESLLKWGLESLNVEVR
jgi:hypothetical protein